MNILSIEFSPTWSWGLIFAEMSKYTDVKFKRSFYHKGDKINTNGVDMALCQNVTLLKKFKERIRTVCRMGGNYNFDGLDKLEPLLKEMSKCYCLIATNNKLYKIGKSVNNNVHLIPNGIDLKEWGKVSRSAKKTFTVGFCGNIATPQYREYKGYDFVKEACSNLGIELKTALYRSAQIPHDKMRELFYSEIDCIVHPTLGEGCSNTLMEACACGVPIITTKVAGFHGEMMKHNNNILFCKRTTKSIQNIIKRLKKDKKLSKKLSAGSRAFAVKHHNVLKIVKQYEKIFGACIENNRKNGPSIRFYSLVNTPSKVTAVYNINGEDITSEKFPPGYTKDQIIADITRIYNQRTK